MERKNIFFLIAGSALILTALGIGIYLLVKNPDDEKKDEEKDKGGSGDGNNEPKPQNPPSNNPAPINNPAPANNTSSIQNGQVVPIFNEEGELKNSLSQLKDRQLYPKRKWQGGWDYANIRSSAEVNTESAWYDPFDNLLTTIGAGTPIGKVTGETTGVYNSYAYRWFKVRLNKPVGFWGTTYDAYVRADNVTFVAYTP